MLFYFASNAKKRWLRGVHRYITSRLKKFYDLEKKKPIEQQELMTIRYYQWRLAYNYYHGGLFKEAMNYFKELVIIPEDALDTTDMISNYNITAGACCLELFYENKDHEYLKQAYQFYQQGIYTMKFDLFVMFRLPIVLSEFGRVLEHYGNFEGALGLYSKVLSNFPTFRGYFNVMYRVGIVGKYVGEMSTGAKGQEINDQCIDILQFLLEALPITIEPVCNMSKSLYVCRQLMHRV